MIKSGSEFWFRIDNRLVHGQVIEGWLPYLGVRELIVVNDPLSRDELQQQIMRLAVPSRVALSFIPVVDVKKRYDFLNQGGISALFLLANCFDARRVREQGVPMHALNIGNMHYGPGKRQICAHVAISDEDMNCLLFLEATGTALDFRCVPADSPVLEDWK